MSTKFDCPECGAILSGSDTGPPEICPECGASTGGASPGTTRPEGSTRAHSAVRRSSRVRPQDLRSSNPSMAIFGAVGGAVLGALIWAGITYFTHYEVGWVAWGIGGLVGGGCVMLGGRGQNMAVLCAALALVSIFLGKLLATQFLIGSEIEKAIAHHLTHETYQETRQDWTDFAKLEDPITDDQLREFMATHSYTEGNTPAEVTADEIAYFRAQTIPFLRGMASSQPTIEQWRDGAREEMRSMMPLMDFVKEDLSLFDFLWAFLGVSTAYGLLMKTTMQEAMAIQRAARAERAESEQE